MSSYRDDLPSSTTLEPDRWVTRMEGDVDEEDEYDQPDLATTINASGNYYDDSWEKISARSAPKSVSRRSTKANEGTEEARILAGMGNELYTHGDLEGAIKHLEKALQISERMVDALSTLAMIKSELGQYQEAVDAYVRAGKAADKKSAAPLFQKAAELCLTKEVNDPSQAFVIYGYASRANAGAFPFMARLEILEKCGREGIERAILKELDGAVKAEPKDLDIATKRANTIQKFGNLNKALEAWEYAFKIIENPAPAKGVNSFQVYDWKKQLLVYKPYTRLLIISKSWARLSEVFAFIQPKQPTSFQLELTIVCIVAAIHNNEFDSILPKLTAMEKQKATTANLEWFFFLVDALIYAERHDRAINFLRQVEITCNFPSVWLKLAQSYAALHEIHSKEFNDLVAQASAQNASSNTSSSINLDDKIERTQEKMISADKMAIEYYEKCFQTNKSDIELAISLSTRLRNANQLERSKLVIQEQKDAINASGDKTNLEGEKIDENNSNLRESDKNKEQNNEKSKSSNEPSMSSSEMHQNILANSLYPFPMSLFAASQGSSNIASGNDSTSMPPPPRSTRERTKQLVDNKTFEKEEYDVRLTVQAAMIEFQSQNFSNFVDTMTQILTNESILFYRRRRRNRATLEDPESNAPKAEANLRRKPFKRAKRTTSLSEHVFGGISSVPTTSSIFSPIGLSSSSDMQAKQSTTHNSNFKSSHLSTELAMEMDEEEFMREMDDLEDDEDAEEEEELLLQPTLATKKRKRNERAGPQVLTASDPFGSSEVAFSAASQRWEAVSEQSEKLAELRARKNIWELFGMSVFVACFTKYCKCLLLEISRFRENEKIEALMMERRKEKEKSQKNGEEGEEEGENEYELYDTKIKKIDGKYYWGDYKSDLWTVVSTVYELISKEDAFHLAPSSVPADQYVSLIERADVRFLVAQVAGALKLFQFATELVRKVCHAYPHNTHVWSFYFRIVSKTRNFFIGASFVRRLSETHLDSVPLQLLSGHLSLMTRSYPFAIIGYLRAYKADPQMPVTILCAGIAYLGRALSRTCRNRQAAVARGFAFIYKYYLTTRFGNDGNPHEAIYNLARAFHHLTLYQYAIPLYKLVLQDNPTKGIFDPNYPPDETTISGFSLKREAAYNLAVIYKNSGSPQLARELFANYLTF